MGLMYLAILGIFVEVNKYDGATKRLFGPLCIFQICEPRLFLTFRDFGGQDVGRGFPVAF